VEEISLSVQLHQQNLNSLSKQESYTIFQSNIFLIVTHRVKDVRVVGKLQQVSYFQLMEQFSNLTIPTLAHNRSVVPIQLTKFSIYSTQEVKVLNRPRKHLRLLFARDP